MAIGDAAAAAGMDLVPGSTRANEIDDEINKTRDYIADRTSEVTPVAKGGTGAATPAAARTNLGIPAWSTSADANTLIQRNVNGHSAVPTPTNSAHIANKSYVDGTVGGKATLGTDVTFGHIYTPGSIAASSGYVVAYINGDGRISRGASSERYKDDITLIDPASLGEVFPDLYTFRMKGTDTTRVGWIAERLAENPDLLPFVVFAREPVTDDDGEVIGYQIALDEHGEPIPESIDFIALLQAQNAQMHERLRKLEERDG